jgi:hypothetical protein
VLFVADAHRTVIVQKRVTPGFENQHKRNAGFRICMLDTEWAEFAHDGDHTNTPRYFVSYNMPTKAEEAQQSVWVGRLNFSSLNIFEIIFNNSVPISKRTHYVSI